MRILMFPQRPFPCNHAMLESVYARILPERGHDVHWVMRAADHDPAQPIRTWHGSTVHTIPLRHGSPVVNARVAVAKALAARRLLGGLEVETYDVVQVRNEIGPSLAALRARSRGRFAFVYQMSFPSAEFRIAAARRREMRPRLYHLARGWAELVARRRVLRGADAVLAISDTMRQQLLGDLLLDASCVVTFPLGYDATVEPDAHAAAAARHDLGLSDRPLAVYFGTISSARRLDVFLVQTLAAARLLVPRLALLIIGSDGDARRLAAAFAEARLSENVIFTGMLSRQETARHVAAADVSLVPYPPSPEFISASPTKLIESLGLGVPVVANQEVHESAAVVRASGGGLLVEYDPTAFGEAVARLVSDPGLRAGCAESGAKWVRRYRDYGVLATQVEQLYETLVSRVRDAAWRQGP